MSRNSLLLYLLNILLIGLYFFNYYALNEKYSLSITLATIFCLIELFLFAKIIYKNYKINIIPDIGFVYACLIVIYTMLPAVGLLTELRADDPIRTIQASNADLVNQIWRHLIFLCIFVLSYLMFKGGGNYSIDIKKIKINKKLIRYLLALLIICICLLLYLSGPVNNYYESYTRFQDLPWLYGKVASVCIRFKYSIYLAILTIMFINYEYYKKYIIFFLISIILFEFIFNYGARIQVLIIVIQAICLFSILINQISLRSILLIGFLFTIIFGIVEIIRLPDYESSEFWVNFGFRLLPWEFNSVFYSGLHLYQERNSGALIYAEWPMLFYDFISIFTFNDFTRWNPMVWYHQNYYPTALVAPFTLGPIAESAIWGGEIDLVIRGFINGIFFAIVSRIFIANKYNLWAIIIYVFIYSMSIITLKYSIFYTLTPIIKSIIPIIILIYLINRFILKSK